MELTYTREKGWRTIEKTIEVTPTLDDYIMFITSKVDNKIWSKEAYEKVEATIKWLFDQGHLVDETFDDDDDFRDYLYDSYEDSVEWGIYEQDEEW